MSAATRGDETVPSDRAAAAAQADARSLLLQYWTPRRGVAAVVVLGVVVRLWLLGSGWFHDTDHVLRIRAWELPLDRAYLVDQPIPGITPGLAALQWPLSRAWPLDFTPEALLLIGVQVVVLLLMARLAHRLWPGSWWALVPVTMVALSPLGLAQASWWTAGVPGSLAMLVQLLAILAGLTWWRGGSVLPLLGAGAVWLLASAFGDVLVVTLLLAVIAVPALDLAPGRRRSARAAASVLVAACAATAVVVAARIVLLPDAAYPGRPQAEDWATSMGRVVADAVPALAGGPLQWTPFAPETPLASTPVWWTVVSLQALVALVVLGSALSRRALVAWVWAGGWLVLSVAVLLLTTPVPAAAAATAATLRASAIGAVPLALAVGTSLAVLRGPGRRALARLRPGTAGWGRMAALATTAAVVVASFVSLSGYRSYWAANDGRVYVAGASRSLPVASEGPDLLDQAVPASVLSPLSSPYHLVSRFLEPISPRPAIGPATTQLRVLGADGELRRGIVEGVAGRPGPVPGCGWQLSGSGSVPLTTPVIEFGHTVRLTYFASGDGQATISVGDGEGVAVPIVRGLGEAAVNVVGGGDRVRIAAITPGVRICTDDVVVGAPVVAP